MRNTPLINLRHFPLYRNHTNSNDKCHCPQSSYIGHTLNTLPTAAKGHSQTPVRYSELQKINSTLLDIFITVSYFLTFISWITYETRHVIKSKGFLRTFLNANWLIGVKPGKFRMANQGTNFSSPHYSNKIT